MFGEGSRQTIGIKDEILLAAILVSQHCEDALKNISTVVEDSSSPSLTLRCGVMGNTVRLRASSEASTSSCKYIRGMAILCRKWLERSLSLRRMWVVSKSIATSLLTPGTILYTHE